MESILDQARECLVEGHFLVETVSAPHLPAGQQLVVVFANEELPRPLQIQISLIKDYVSADQHAPIDILVVSTVLFRVDPAVVDDLSPLSRLLLAINAHLMMPGFNLMEGERLVYCREIVKCHDQEIDGRYVLESVGALISAVSDFGDVIEAVASGQMTFVEAENALRELGWGVQQSESA